MVERKDSAMGTVWRASDLVRECKILGKTLVFEHWLVALQKCWSDEKDAYEHSARLYRWITIGVPSPR